MKRFLVLLVVSVLGSATCGQPSPQKATEAEQVRNVPALSATREGSFRYPTFELQDGLADIFSVSDCEYISGMTCRIHYNGKKPLPSEVFFTGYDSSGKADGELVRLIYPQLRPGETGYATFRIRSSSPTKVVLRGKWEGPWRNPY